MKAFLGVVAAAWAVCAAGAPVRDKWVLKYTENFDGRELNPKLWRRIEGRAGEGADWQRNISPREDLATVKNGVLTLHGVVNTDRESDARRVLAGGISTQGLFNTTYGKIEARIRMKGAKGAWPAFWMMPQSPERSWPGCGEIDILERLNGDGFVYQTVHSAWTAAHPADPPNMAKAAVKPESWNIYALEWTPEAITWRINGKITHTYPRVDASPERWPWTVPFYILIDMQLGGKWVGAVDEATLPAAMQVDWVKFYQLFRAGKPVSTFSRPRRKTE